MSTMVLSTSAALDDHDTTSVSLRYSTMIGLGHGLCINGGSSCSTISPRLCAARHRKTTKAGSQSPVQRVYGHKDMRELSRWDAQRDRHAHTKLLPTLTTLLLQKRSRGALCRLVHASSSNFAALASLPLLLSASSLLSFFRPSPPLSCPPPSAGWRLAGMIVSVDF